MAYATTSDVQAIIGGFFTIGASTKPTTTQVGAWLDQYSAKVDSALTAGGYGTIPATGINDALILKEVVAWVVAILTLGTALGWDTEPTTTLRDIFTEMHGSFAEFLDKLAEGNIRLIDQGVTAVLSIRTIQVGVYGRDD